MTRLKSKWGIDISLDYVDDNRYNTMELFHFEWDDNNLDTVLQKKEEIENIILTTDWQDFADYKLKNTDKWIELDFVGQSKWTTEHLNLQEDLN